MILSDNSIIELLENKELIIDPKPLEADIRCNHINLHLFRKLLKYKINTLDLREGKNFDLTNEIIIPVNGYQLQPGEFVLGSTVEHVAIPNGYFGLIETKGNIARAGIQAHNADGHVDPGFIGNITLEIKNNSNHVIIIYSDMAFVQFYLFQSTSKSLNPYQGKYQNQNGATVYKKD